MGGIAVWDIVASLYGILRVFGNCELQAECALRSAVGVNANGALMHARIHIRCVYIHIYIYSLRSIALVRSANLSGPSECRLCGAYAVAVGVIERVPVAVCSACAGLIQNNGETMAMGRLLCSDAFVLGRRYAGVYTLML